MRNEIEILKAKVKNQTNFENKLREYSQENDKLETKIVVLADQLNHYKHLATSIEHRKKTADSLVSTLMRENDDLHLQIASLQEKLAISQGRRSRRQAHKLAKERQNAMTHLLASPKISTIQRNLLSNGYDQKSHKKLKRKRSKQNHAMFDYESVNAMSGQKYSVPQPAFDRFRSQSARQHRPTCKTDRSEDFVYYKPKRRSRSRNKLRSSKNKQSNKNQKWVHAGPTVGSFSKIAKKNMKRKKKFDDKLLGDTGETEYIMNSNYMISPVESKMAKKFSKRNGNDFNKQSNRSIRIKRVLPSSSVANNDTNNNDESWDIESSSNSTDNGNNDYNYGYQHNPIHIDIDNIIQNYDSQLKELGIMSD